MSSSVTLSFHCINFSLPLLDLLQNYYYLHATMNRIATQISFLIFLLLVSKKASEFCVLNLYAASQKTNKKVYILLLC